MDRFFPYLRVCPCIWLFIYLQNLGGGYRNYPEFLKNKAKRLLVPYVFSMLLWVAPISDYFFHWEIAELFKKYVLCINPSQLWFLWMLFGVFVIVWPLRNVMINKPLAGWMVSLVLYGVGTIGGHLVPNVFCIWTACQYVTFFFIGMRIRAKSENRERLITETVSWYCWIILDLIVFIADIWIESLDEIIWGVISIGLSFLLHAIGAAMAWVVLQNLASRINWQDSRSFNTLASYSMPMYLFHQQIIYFTIAALNGVVNPWINVGVNFVAAIAGSLIISNLLMRWKITRFLVGEKA